MESKAPVRRRRGERSCAVLVVSVMTAIVLRAQTPSAFSFGGTEVAGGNYVGANPDGTQTLAGHVPLEVRNGTAVVKYHASLDIEGRIILPLRNQPELAELLEDLYNPNSPKFHKFLTPDEFAQRFSADATDAMQVQEFLKGAGISVTAGQVMGRSCALVGHRRHMNERSVCASIIIRARMALCFSPRTPIRRSLPLWRARS